MDFDTFVTLCVIALGIQLLPHLYEVLTDKTGKYDYSDEERAAIEKYYNEHGTVPKWVITGRSPFRKEEY